MPSQNPNTNDAHERPPVLYLALIYAGFASLWILLTDSFLGWLITDSAEITHISIIKGLAFVSITTLLLYSLLRRAAEQARSAAERENLLQSEKLRALQMLNAIAEGSTDAIFAKDTQGRYVLFNKAAERVVGKIAEQVLGNTDTAIFPPAEAAMVMADDRRIMDENSIHTYEHSLNTTIGTRVFLTTQGPMFDPDGKISGVFGIARDITERKNAEVALRESENQFRTLFESAAIAIIIHDKDSGKIIAANHKAIESYGFMKLEELQRNDFWLEPPYSVDDALLLIRQAAESPQRFEWKNRDRHGRIFWEDVRLDTITLSGIVRVLSISTDITERKQAEEQLLKLSLAVEQSPESVMITDLDARIEYVNQAFVTKTGYSREEVAGKNPRLLQSGKTPRASYQALWQSLTAGLPWQGELYNLRKDGSEYIEHAIISPLRQPDGRITHYVAIKQDITQMKFAEAEINRLAFYDSLTGLPNRTLLLERGGLTLAVTRREQHHGALLLFNIDRFKNINDAGGPMLGDEVLRATATRLTRFLRENDMLARLSGDEFAILLPGLAQQPDTAAHQALHIVEKILSRLREPIHLEGQIISLTACMGIALFPENEQDTVQDLLRRCNTALHHAKSRGTAQVTFFDNNLENIARQRFNIEQELHQAIAGSELCIHLQPQVEASGKMVGAEVLVRWQHPLRGLLPPGTFIPIAEESDLIIGIGEWVFAETCRLLVHPDVACRPLRISVNISPRHFRQPDFVGWIKRSLATCGADPARLTLEITEGLVIDNPNEIAAKMTELAELGIHFSMDDFGTGYSSLSYLKRLPLHELKIDKTFVQDAPTDPSDAALVETILAVASHLHLKVVAEGVETTEQADFLNARANVIHQGYLYGKPAPVEAWLEDLRQRGGNR